jgi:two-component system, NarL family, nitrate/nitrite response regulator NarL
MPQDARPIRVLLVDDHRTVLWGLEKLIKGEEPNMQVAGTASTRHEALNTARLLNPDIILLDLDLNRESSLDFLPDLVQQAQAKVVVLTGMRGEEYRMRAMMQGASGVVRKEESAETILQAIERVYHGELWLDRVSTASVLTKLTAKKPNHAEAQKISPLTVREREVVAVMVEHRSADNKTIAERLHISGHTLRNHLSSIYSKLGLKNRMELYLYAKDHGCLEN